MLGGEDQSAPPARDWQHAVRTGVRGAVAGLFAATVAAEIALLPVSAGVFSRVGVAGLGLNFVAIPAMSIVEIGGFVMCATASWLPWTASQAATVVDAAARVLVRSTTVLDVAPWLSWRVPPTSVAWAVGVLRRVGPRAVDARAATLAAGLEARPARCSAILIASAPLPAAGRPAAGWLRLTMLDVGQGDALALQWPTGQTLLVDAGGLGEFDVGGRVVTPALWALGVRRLDWLAFTHPDGDHIGGALAVAQRSPAARNLGGHPRAEEPRARGSARARRPPPGGRGGNCARAIASRSPASRSTRCILRRPSGSGRRRATTTRSCCV